MARAARRAGPQEAAARRYNERVEALARQAAGILGPAYGTEPASWARVVELWDARDPAVDEARAWEEAWAEAAADPGADPEALAAEVPVRVAMRVFPHRVAILRDLGGADEAEWAAAAERIERLAAKRRAEAAEASPPFGAVAPVAGAGEG